MNLFYYKTKCVKQLQTLFIKISFLDKDFCKDRCTNFINKVKLKF